MEPLMDTRLEMMGKSQPCGVESARLLLPQSKARHPTTLLVFLSQIDDFDLTYNECDCMHCCRHVSPSDAGSHLGGVFSTCAAPSQQANDRLRYDCRSLQASGAQYSRQVHVIWKMALNLMCS